MRHGLVAVMVLCLFAVCLSCTKKLEKRVEGLELRMQASEFLLAGLAELEPRMLEEMEQSRSQMKAQEVKLELSAQIAQKTEVNVIEYQRRLEMVEQWIQEKDKEDEKRKLHAWEDGSVPTPWVQLANKCEMDRLGEAQTVLNWMVRINAYMSDFPIHHPVDLASPDPILFITAPMVPQAGAVKTAYRTMELDILKGRDQWLGYRIDNSWETRPEWGTCKTACCRVDLAGNWGCYWSAEHDRWGSPGTHSRWECEYDAEGWRDYKARWWRTCDYLSGTREFATMPYLMKRVEEEGAGVQDPIYCVVDIIWENRIYCLSHSQYPVIQIRLEQGKPDQPLDIPAYSRFSLLAVYDWDVLWKDEWSSIWVVEGVSRPKFPGQKTGFRVELVQEPTCSVASDPVGVMRLLEEYRCMDSRYRDMEMQRLLRKYGFKDQMDLEIQRMWMSKDPEWSQKLHDMLTSPCS